MSTRPDKTIAVTTQAREGIETESLLPSSCACAVTTQAHEGIDIDTFLPQL